MKLALTLARIAAMSCLVACRDDASSGAPHAIAPREAPASVCMKENAQCVFAEGKIGLCTARPGECDAGDASCLVCMSLH